MPPIEELSPAGPVWPVPPASFAISFLVAEPIPKVGTGHPIAVD